MTTWTLAEGFASQGGEVAYEVIGEGPPVILVHGTPSWSFLWRRLVDRLRSDWRVYVYDLLGYGLSDRYADQDVSVRKQAQVLAELIDHWGLAGRSPCIAGHDIGGTIALASHVLEGRAFSKIALLDAVVLSPWGITPTTRHQLDHLECYKTMPTHIYEKVALAHLETAFYRLPAEDVLSKYMAPWEGDEGQAAWYRKIEQFDETVTDEMAPALSDLEVPVKLIWGEHDQWLSREKAQRAQRVIATAELEFIPEAGHFSPEDNPAGVHHALTSFFREE